MCQSVLPCSVDAEHFGCPPPQLPLMEELRADIARHEEMWTLYEDYSTQLREMTTQDWISFR